MSPLIHFFHIAFPASVFGHLKTLPSLHRRPRFFSCSSLLLCIRVIVSSPPPCSRTRTNHTTYNISHRMHASPLLSPLLSIVCLYPTLLLKTSHRSLMYLFHCGISSLMVFLNTPQHPPTLRLCKCCYSSLFLFCAGHFRTAFVVVGDVRQPQPHTPLFRFVVRYTHQPPHPHLISYPPFELDTYTYATPPARLYCLVEIMKGKKVMYTSPSHPSPLLLCSLVWFRLGLGIIDAWVHTSFVSDSWNRGERETQE